MDVNPLPSNVSSSRELDDYIKEMLIEKDEESTLAFEKTMYNLQFTRVPESTCSMVHFFKIFTLFEERVTKYH